MKPRAKRFPTHHGYGEVKVSRYLALYAVLLGWVGLGVYLYHTAFWPSTCRTCRSPSLILPTAFVTQALN